LIINLKSPKDKPNPRLDYKKLKSNKVWNKMLMKTHNGTIFDLIKGPENSWMKSMKENKKLID
jgi:hypothetical protein